MTDRCEPPPELRGRHGWHWVRENDGPTVMREWSGVYNKWRSLDMPAEPPLAYHVGWRYDSPVAALRTERDAAVAAREVLATEEPK